jgi:O-antigen/teichoic acid export membrane protein
VETKDAPGAPSAESIARAGGLNLAGRLTSGAAVFGLAVITTNVLDTYGRGVYAILSTWAGIAMTILTGGTAVLAADLIHGREGEPLLHGVACAVAAQAGLLLFPLAAVVAVIADGVSSVAILCAAAIAALLTYCNFEMSIAQARGDIVRVSLADIGMAVLPLLLTAIAAFAVEDPTVAMLMAAWAIGALLLVCLQLTDAIRTRGVVLKRSWSVAAGIMRRSVGVSAANGVALLMARIDVLVVAAILGTSAAGVYSIPVALAASLLLLSRALLTATYRPIMTASADEVGARLSGALRHGVIVVLAAGCLSIPFVAFLAGPVFGDAYSGIWEPYTVLVPASAFLCVGEMLRHFLITRLERQREILLTSAGMLIANGILAVAGSALFGMMGAAASTTIAYAGGVVALVIVCARSLSMPVLSLAVPRRSDLIPYLRLVRLMATKLRSARSVP